MSSPGEADRGDGYSPNYIPPSGYYNFTIVLRSIVGTDEEIDERIAKASGNEATIVRRGGEILLRYSVAVRSIALAVYEVMERLEDAGFAVARVEIDRDEGPCATTGRELPDHLIMRPTPEQEAERMRNAEEARKRIKTRTMPYMGD